MKNLNKPVQHIIVAAVILFSISSVIYMAFASQPFTTVLEAERNIIIEEQHDIQENTSKLKSKLQKEEERLQRLQGLVDSLKTQIRANQDQHNMNTGRIEQITRTLEVYTGLVQEK